jgi:hypothetical protein
MSDLPPAGPPQEPWSPPPYPPPGVAPPGPATPPPPAYGYGQGYGTGPAAGFGYPYGPGGPGGYGYQPPARTNGNAVASLVCGICAFVVCPLTAIAGIVTGVRARRQIRDSGGQEQGDGLAVAGLVISGLGLVYLVGLAIFLAFFITLAATLPSVPTTPTAPTRPYPTAPTSVTTTTLG